MTVVGSTKRVKDNQYTFEWIREVCCDYCNDVIHSHFDCPICLTIGIGTNYISDPMDEEIGNSFNCNKCHARFTLMDTSASWCDNWIWEHHLTINPQ